MENSIRQRAIEAAALALVNLGSEMMDLPHLKSLDEFRFDVDRRQYLKDGAAAFDAIIQILSEPDEAMIEAGYLAAVDGDWGEFAEAADIWKAMIQSAKEG